MTRNFEALDFLGDTLDLTSLVPMTSEKRIDPTAGDRNVLTGCTLFTHVSDSHSVAFGGVSWIHSNRRHSMSSSMPK
jgi:hypothetical protein